MIDSATALAQTPLFAGLGRLELARLAAQLEELRFAPGQVVVAQGDVGDSFYVVKDGSADVLVEGDAGPARVNRLGPGQGFGEMALLTGAPRTASVVAATDLVVWRLSAEQFRAQFGRDTTMSFKIARQLAAQLAHHSRELADLRAVSPTGSRPHPVLLQEGEGTPLGFPLPLGEGQGEGVVPEHLLTGRRAIGVVLAAMVLAAAALLPPPAGLDRPAMLALGSALGAVPLLVFGLLPDYAVALALVAALVVSGAAPPAVALGGFATPSWVMALVLFAIGAALGRSGLLYRLALFAVVKLPSNFGAQGLAVALAGLTVSMGVTNGTPRVALAGPAVRATAEALRLRPRSAGAAALGLIAYVAFGETNALFVTSSSSALLLQALMPGPDAARVTWGFWFAAGVVPNLAFIALSCLAIVLLLRPPFRVAVDPENVRLQRRLLGPITRSEVACVAALVVLVAGFATQGYHGLSPPWVAVGALLVLVLLGALDAETFRTGVSWGTMIYLGALIGLGGVFARLGIDAWLAGAVVGPLATVVKNPYAFVLAVGLAAFALHFVVPLATASPLLALATMPLAVAAGYSPLVPALTVILAGDHMVLPYVGTHYRALLATTEGELFDDRQARPLLLMSPLFRLVALVASVPYWQALGLM